AQALAQLGPVLLRPRRAERSAAGDAVVRELALGQALGLSAAELPLHLHADPDAPPARSGGGRGDGGRAEPAPYGLTILIGKAVALRRQGPIAVQQGIAPAGSPPSLG